MNYDKQLEKYDKFGIKLGLENILAILQYLGNPQNELETIHIAGTNGKGSTLSMIDSSLNQAGFKTLRYSSPYLIDPDEMFLNNQQIIDKSELNESFQIVANAMDARSIQLSRYEITTVMAILLAKKLKVDYTLLETGLGGRLDATNVCNAKYTLITNVGLDHMQFLGNSLSQIAKEKAAIVNSFGYLGSNQQEIIEALNGKPYIVCNQIQHQVMDEGVSRVKVNGQEYKLGLNGYHQVDNFLLAYKVLTDIGIDVESIKLGVLNVSWPGRMEVLRNNPNVIFDGAHNQPAIESLIKSIDLSNSIVVFSTFKDKSYDQYINLLLSECDCMYYYQMEEERGLSASEFEQSIDSINYKGQLTNPQLLCLFETTAKQVVCCGSLSFYKYVKSLL